MRRQPEPKVEEEKTVECEKGHNMLLSEGVCKKCGSKVKEVKGEEGET